MKFKALLFDNKIKMDSSKQTKNYRLSINKDGVVITPIDREPKYCLIWLHGITGSGTDYIGFFIKNEPFLSINDEFKFVLPTATIRSVDYMGIKSISPSWYDIKTKDWNYSFDKMFSIPEIEESTKRIHLIIENEIKLIGDSSRVFLGGHSQGVAMSLHAGLTFNQKLGGFIGWCGYFFEITKESNENSETPILIIHGLADDIRPWKTVKHTFKRLEGKSNVKFEFIPGMGHFMRNDDAKKILINWINEKAQ